jgi:replicative DNA helicase
VADLFDHAAERAVIGAALTSPTSVRDACAILTPEAFHHLPHEWAWAAIRGLYDQGSPVDAITVAAAMRRDGTLTKAPPTLLPDCIGEGRSEAVRAYARIVADCHTRRRIVTAATRSILLAEGMEAAPKDLLNTVIDELAAAGQSAIGDAPTLPEQVTDAVDAIEGTQTAGWSWPWPDLGRILLPAAPGQFILVAARPGVGKSVCLVDIARHVAIDQNQPVVLHTLEMSTREVIHRILAAEGRVQLDHIKRSILTEDEWGRLAQASQRLSAAPLTIIDSPTAGLGDVRASIRQHKPVVVLFDYFQLGRTNPDVRDRRLALEELSRGLKITAKETGVPIVAAAQVRRKPQGHEAEPPVLSDLRETGSLEQDCDVAVMLHRLDVEDPVCERAGEIDLTVAKQRNGPTGTATLVHQLHYSRFADMAH